MQALLFLFFFVVVVVFFFHVSVPKGSSESQAFAAIEDCGNWEKESNHDYFHCMQMSLVMSMQFILTMTKMTHSVDHVLAVWQ